MTYHIKYELEDGKIEEIVFDGDINKAVEKRSELQAKGHKSWIEDTEGRRVGFTEIEPPARR
ncbi:MAG: hypothetical protein WDN29_16485 [Methylovirgula sp.]